MHLLPFLGWCYITELHENFLAKGWVLFLFLFVFYSFQAPEITLQIASGLPAMEASDNAFQGSFFYQVLQIPSLRCGVCRILGSSKERQKQKEQM